MSRRLLIAAAAVAFGLSPLLTPAASAQEVTTDRVAPPLLFSASNMTLPAVPAVDDPQIPLSILRGRPWSSQSKTMVPLYATTAVMQALDVHSTLQAFKGGAVEGNPIMAGIAAHKPLFVAVKSAVAVGTIMAVRSIAKRHKVRAIVALVAMNSAYALIVSHNYKLARSLR